MFEGGREKDLGPGGCAANQEGMTDAQTVKLHYFPLEISPAGMRASTRLIRLQGGVFNLLARRNDFPALQKLCFHANNGYTNEKDLSSLH